MSKKLQHVFRNRPLTSDEVADDEAVRQQVRHEFPPHAAKLSELQLEPPLSIEETEKLRANKIGKPLSEILSRLGVQ
jgi:hypothetical protein